MFTEIERNFLEESATTALIPSLIERPNQHVERRRLLR